MPSTRAKSASHVLDVHDQNEMTSPRCKQVPADHMALAHVALVYTLWTLQARGHPGTFGRGRLVGCGKHSHSVNACVSVYFC